MNANCPTCVRLGRVCHYCDLFCNLKGRNPRVTVCDDVCHVADVEYEAKIQAEKIEQLRKALDA